MAEAATAPRRVLTLLDAEPFRARLVEGEGARVLVDATGEPQVFALAMNPEQPGLCLYSGLAAAPFVEYAPYLFDCSPQVFHLLAEMGVRHNSALFIRSAAPTESLVEHWRRFLTVERTEGAPALFRFFDPEIAQIYLEHSTDEEVRAFLGPCSGIGGECEDGSFWIVDGFPSGPEAQYGKLPVMRPEHEAAFAARVWHRFVRRMAESVAASHPEDAAAHPGAEWLEVIDELAREADDAGIIEEESIERYLRLALDHEQLDPDRRPAWVAQLLARPEMPGAWKVDELERRLLFAEGGSPP